VGREWKCTCKDCGKHFAYSDSKYQAGRVRGWSRPERCDSCRAQHAREIRSLGQAYYKPRALKPLGDSRRLTSDLGRFDRADRPHVAKDTQPPPLDPNKFGIKDDRLVEMFDFFKQDPGLQVAVVVGPTGSGKSTYFPFRLIELPESFKGPAGDERSSYWTVPIETEEDLAAAREEVEHTPLSLGQRRFYKDRPDDPRAEEHQVSGPEGLDPRMFHRYGQVVITQPRIQATRGIPRYIAGAMMGCELGAGHDVGFRHSESPNSDWSTKLAFVTDGTLITWIAKGELDKINTIMIDEAHERSLNIDIIIGLLTQLLPRYPRLRLLIASATISSDLFINHFNQHLPKRYDAAGNLLPNCRLMNFEGKSFKVSPHFRTAAPLDYYREDLPAGPEGEKDWEGKYRAPGEIHTEVADQALEILEAMYCTEANGGYLEDQEEGSSEPRKIDITERQGDILCFLHGEKPIQNCVTEIKKRGEDVLAGKAELKVLPLYTTLKQSEQDEALMERPQPHAQLQDAILEQLEAFLNGTPRGDILAILNNAGKIHELCDLLRAAIQSPTRKKNKDQEEPNPLYELREQVDFLPWFTPLTARQLFEDNPERAELQIPPHDPGKIRVVISTTRHLSALPDDNYAHRIELPPEERRVVISTNVAETSLTIHGILHVVDSGLINQNKWDQTTKTSNVAPILQSRAGCKQRWGRAGRLQAGDAWLLYTRDQFGKDDEDENPERCFISYSRPEITRSPLEQVLLTAKKAGVESLDASSFPWLDAPDPRELARSKESLEMKGALDPDGDLTEHGVELGNMRNEPHVGNLIVMADRFACALEMATVISMASVGLKRILSFDKEWDEQTIQDVRRKQAQVLEGCSDDLDAALKLVACWEEALASGAAFVENLRLARGQDLIAKRQNASRNQAEKDAIQAFLNTTDEDVAARHLETMTRHCHGNRDLIRDVRRAAEESLRIRKENQRLNPVFQAIVNAWSFTDIWLEGVAAPVLAKAILKKDTGEKDREKALEIIGPFLAEFRLAEDPAGIIKKVDKQLQKWSKKKIANLDIRELHLLADLANPVLLCEKGILEKTLQSRAKNPPRIELIWEAFEALPAALARAWARANYLNPDTIESALEERAEILTPLETHKKEAENRPLDLSRNDRLRLLVAQCMSENAFLRSSEGKYQAALVATGDDEVLEVVPTEDSVCAGDIPALFVCLDRRAGPYVPGTTRRLFVAFLLRLPEKWRDEIRAADIPLHEWNAMQLSRFISLHCARNHKLGRHLMMNFAFPRGASCQVQLKQMDESGMWEGLAAPPHTWPDKVVPRFKKASEEESRDPETEEVVTPRQKRKKDLGLTRDLKEMQAGFDPGDSEKSQVASGELEMMFAADGAGDTPPADTSENTLATVVSEEVHRPSWTRKKTPVKVRAKGSFQVGDTLDAEVIGTVVAAGDSALPLLQHPGSRKSNEVLTSGFGPETIGREFTLEAIRYEHLALDNRMVLVAREIESGVEVILGPSDLSFSTCGQIPRIIFDRLGLGGQFKARLVQFDRECGRIRMTTHHVFDELKLETEKLCGVQEVELLVPVPRGSFARIRGLDEAEARGFMVVAMIGGERFGAEEIGSVHQVFIGRQSTIKESWPEGVPVPAGLDSERKDEEVLLKSKQPLSWQATLDHITGQTGHITARAALYSLYERTNRLIGIDETTHDRLVQYVGSKVQGRIIEVNPGGIELRLEGRHDCKAWLPGSEFTWLKKESHLDCQVDEELEVQGMELDFGDEKVIVSRRALTPNPFEDYRVGQRVICEDLNRKDRGWECSVDGLHGWIPESFWAELPQEDIGNAQQFEAEVHFVEEGKLVLSRWPVVQKAIRSMATKYVLRCTVTRVESNGLEVELAPGIRAWLPGSEISASRERVSLQNAFAPSQPLDVIILPAQADDRDDKIVVSRKRAWSQEIVVSGIIGRFVASKRYNNMKTVLSKFQGMGEPVFIHTLADGSSSKHMLVGADRKPIASRLVSDLSSVARMNNCTFAAKTEMRKGPVELASIPLPKTRKPVSRTRTRTAKRGAKSATAGSGSSLWDRIKGFFRRLFGG
jgi:HrpA-like RNA helicase